MRKSLSLLSVLGFTLFLVLAYKQLVLDYQQELTSDSPIIVLVPKNASAKAIGRLLEQHHVIPSSDLFYWSVRLRKLGPKLRSGEYEFSATRSLKSVVERLTRGDVLYHRLTIPEGLTSLEIQAILKAEPKLTGDVMAVIPEGSLLPETYSFSRGDTRASMIKKMAENLNKALDDLWDKRAPDLPLETKQEALILASIVEKETALAVERPRVAAVFINRLRKGMLLQTDPTVIYALELKTGKPLDRALLKKDLSIESPFNTYLHEGLTPTPICHAGLDSLKAVLNPIQSDDLFFVADGSGGHAFSKTYKEHAKNHNNWRKIRRKAHKSLK